MKPDDIFDAMTDISDENLEVKPKFRSLYLKQMVAAVVAIALLASLPRIIGGRSNGGSDGVAEDSAAGESIDFMEYIGPILPLTATGDEVTVSRNLSLDFSPYTPLSEENYPKKEVEVKDEYVFENSGKITLAYPITTSFYDFENDTATLSLNGEALDYSVKFGDLTASFMGVKEDDDRELNLFDFNTYEEYLTALSDGNYFENAQSSGYTLDTPIVLYTVTNVVSPDKSDEAQAPHLNLKIQMDYSKTSLHTFGFDGGSIDEENGIREMSSSVYGDLSDELMMFAVIGDDVANIETQGYKNGATEDGNELDGVSCEIVRTESTLGEFLDLALAGYLDSFENSDLTNYDLILSAISRYVEINEDAERYYHDMAEDYISDVMHSKRVFYLVVELDVNSGDVFVADFVKKSSFNHYGHSGEHENMHGYDFATKLGSSLDFTRMGFSLVNFENVFLVGTNIPIDPENGIFETELDLDIDRYFLNVSMPE